MRNTPSTRKSIKRTALYTAYTPEGLEAVRLLCQHGHGLSVSDVANAAVCKEAARISKEARARLEAFNTRRDNELITALQDQVTALTDMVHTLTNLVGLRRTNGGHDDA